MVTPVIVVLDKARDLGFEITGQVIVLEQNAVLERLVPALDLALGLRMARGAANIAGRSGGKFQFLRGKRSLWWDTRRIDILVVLDRLLCCLLCFFCCLAHFLCFLRHSMGPSDISVGLAAHELSKQCPPRVLSRSGTIVPNIGEQPDLLNTGRLLLPAGFHKISSRARQSPR